VVLINAVYFKAVGLGVQQGITRTEAFNSLRVHAGAGAMMQQRSNYAVVARQGYKAIRLPYEVQALGMVIVLPDAVDGLSESPAGSAPKSCRRRWRRCVRKPAQPVALAMPRFKSSSPADLKKPSNRLA